MSALDDGGEPLTVTTASGSGTTIPVEYARYFHDGFDIDYAQADPVQVGTSVARIEGVDWSN